MACTTGDDAYEEITRVIHPARLAVDVLLAEAGREDRSAEERAELDGDAVRVAASIRWSWATTGDDPPSTAMVARGTPSA